jgi:hypothetical protein
MLRIYDDTSEFDVPIDVLWDYLEAPGEHRKAHPDTRNYEVTELSQNSFLLTMEQKFGARWFKGTGRLTVVRPLGSVSETLEGHLAGSKYFVYYTPRGDKTGVTVVGDFTSTEFPESQLKPMMYGLFAQFFDEDRERLREFIQRK